MHSSIPFILQIVSQTNIDYLRIILVFAVSLMYAIFDVFNKRNIPNMIAYIGIAFSLVFCILANGPYIAFAMLIALLVGAISYLLYKGGQLGAGDGFEFITLVLLMPVQSLPLLTTTSQLGLPFIFSIFVATGFATAFAIPTYYLTKLKLDGDKLSLSHVDANTWKKATIMLVAYAALVITLAYSPLGIRLLPYAFIMLIGILSALIIIYEKKVNTLMVSWVYPKELDDGDILALNLVSKKDKAYFIKRVKNFSKLATPPMINNMKSIRKKLPVYKKAVPFALLTFIGVALSLLFGNLLFFIL